jgi:hypothetical protein
MKRKTKWIKISLLSLLGLIILVLGIAFGIAYFRGSKILKQYLTDMVFAQSKGLYTLEIKDLHITLIPGWISLNDVSLVPDTLRFNELRRTDTIGSTLYTVHVSRIQVRGIDFVDMLRKQTFDIRKILVMDPKIRVDVYKPQVKKVATQAQHKKRVHINLPDKIASLEIDQIRLSKGSLVIADHRGDTLKELVFPVITIEADNIHADHSGKPDSRLYNADDIRVSVNGFSITTGNKLYKIVIGEAGISTKRSEVFVKGFTLTPQMNRTDFAKKCQYQTDQMTVKLASLVISGLKFDTAILTGEIHAQKLTLTNLDLVDYRDQRYPRRPGIKPPLPPDMISKIPVRMTIDSVRLTASRASYSEQVGAKPGTIFFSDLNAVMYPVTNDSAMLVNGYTMNVKGSALMMGKGRMNALFAFKVPDKDKTFTFSADIWDMDLRELNPMVSELVPVSIISGQLKHLEAHNVFCTDIKSRGTLKFYYNNLEIEMEKKDQKTWTSIKSSVLGWAANTYVSSDNPNSNGKFKEGVILFERDHSKSIFNYLWKSIFTGLKSTIGINSKEQKEIKKEKKAAKKEQKKKDKKK